MKYLKVVSLDNLWGFCGKTGLSLILHVCFLSIRRSRHFTANVTQASVFWEFSCPSCYFSNWRFSSINVTIFVNSTAWKVSVFGIFLARIFSHLDWIRRDIPYLSAFSPNAAKYGPEKLWMRTLFTQCSSAKITASIWKKAILKIIRITKLSKLDFTHIELLLYKFPCEELGKSKL